ncbi:MAG: TonB-dependent receptor plug domain-containing protein, partial [Rhodanobacteraceae bacterium]
SSPPAPNKTLQPVIVTGSRIRQVDLQTQQPILVMTRQEIQATGLTTVNDILGHLDTIQTEPGANRQSTQGGTAGSYPDMRGLGASRVLVLVNGHRWMTDNNGRTDLATIPSSVIERIEVLKDGASAVYGSDAVTGVINIITRRNVDGLEADGYVGANEEGDGMTQQYSVTMGSGASNKGSIMMNLSYMNQDIIWNRTRELTRYPDGPRHPTTSYYQVGALGSFTDDQGLYYLNGPGLDTSKLSNYQLVDPSNKPLEDTYNNFLPKPFRTPRRLKSVYIQGQYNFSENLSFYSTTMYVENRGWNQMAGFPMQSHYFNLSDGLLSKDSIYNPVDQDVAVGVDFINRPRTVTNQRKSEQEIAGLKGAFELNGHSWTWDVGLNYSKSSGKNVTLNNLNYWYMQRAMGPSFINSAGQPTCGTPGNPLNDCIPLNVLAGDQAIDATPELANKVFITSQTDTTNKDMSYSADATGGLFDIPFGGEVAVAVGAQHRSLTGSDEPDAFTQSGLSSNNVAAGTRGGYDVNAVYAELSVPLLKNLPGAKLLLFDAATRYSHYSNFGGTTNSKLSIQYKPIDDLMIRANYAQAFRAPTISDLYAGTGQGFGQYTDPCDAAFGARIYGAAVHAACIASLRSAGYPNPDQFRQAQAQGGAISAPNAQTKNAFYSGGNLDLQPETATDKTLGLVYSPHYISGLGITLDWYQIKLANIISPVTANDVLQECYQGVASFCGRFERDANWQVLNLHTGQANRGTAKVQGYDLEVTYALPMTSLGQFRLTSTVSYTDKWEAQEAAGATVDNRVGRAESSGYYWRIRSNTSLAWSKGNFGATWRIRYFSSLTEGCFWGKAVECNDPDHIDPFNGAYPQNRVGAIAFNDVSFRWQSPWQATVRVGVNNVFDRTPPIEYQRPLGSAPVNPAYDIDRFWFVSYSQKFF